MEIETEAKISEKSSKKSSDSSKSKDKKKEKQNSKNETGERKSHAKKNKKKSSNEKSDKTKKRNNKNSLEKEIIEEEIIDDSKSDSPEPEIIKAEMQVSKIPKKSKKKKDTDEIKEGEHQSKEIRSIMQSPIAKREKMEIKLDAPKASPEPSVTPERKHSADHFMSRLKGSTSMDLQKWKESMSRRVKLTFSAENIADTPDKIDLGLGDVTPTKEPKNLGFINRIKAFQSSKEALDEDDGKKTGEQKKEKKKNRSKDKDETTEIETPITKRTPPSRLFTFRLRNALSASALHPRPAADELTTPDSEMPPLSSLPTSAPVSPCESRPPPSAPLEEKDIHFDSENMPSTPIIADKGRNARYLSLRRGRVGRQTLQAYPKSFQRVKERFSKRFSRSKKVNYIFFYNSQALNHSMFFSVF